MRVRCDGCPLVGVLGNSIRWRRVYRARGKSIKRKLCDRCFNKIKVKARP